MRVYRCFRFWRVECAFKVLNFLLNLGGLTLRLLCVLFLTHTAQATPQFDVLRCINTVALFSAGGGGKGIWVYDKPSVVKEGDIRAEEFLSFRDNPTVYGNVILGGGASSTSEFWEGVVKGRVMVGNAAHTPNFVNNPDLCSDVPMGENCIIAAGGYTGSPAVSSPNTNGRPVLTHSGLPYTACQVPSYAGDSDPSETPFSSWSPPSTETLFQFANNTSVELTPDHYGRVRIQGSNNLTVNLYSGTYYLADLMIESSTSIHFKVNLNAAGDPVYFLLKEGVKYDSNSVWQLPNLPSFPVPASSNITWNQNGYAGNLIIYSETGDFTLPSHVKQSAYSVLNAIVVNPDGNIRLIDGNANQLSGSFLASDEVVYYQYSFEELVSLSPSGCEAPADEIGGIAFMQENDLTAQNFVIGDVDDQWRFVQSTYDNTKGNWGGALRAYDIVHDVNTGVASISAIASPAWGGGAVDRLATRAGRSSSGKNTRRVSSSAPDDAQITWDTSALATEQKAQILESQSIFNAYSGTDDQFVEQVVNYHRGLISTESADDFKKRENIMGDSVFCEPKLLGPARTRLMAYHDGVETQHSVFRALTQNRKAYVVTCGNDGVVRLTQLATGDETAAYIPRSVVPKLPITAHRDEVHEYTLDGAITLGDAFIHDAWTTVGIVTCGVGGDCLVALDLGYTTEFEGDNRSRVLWELSGSDLAGTDLNLTVSTASIVRLKDPLATGPDPRYRWVAVFGNGLPATEHNQQAALIVVDLEDKTKQWIVHTPTPSDQPQDGRGNGLGSPNVLDVDADGTADTAIACDRFGQCWLFDLTNLSATPTHLFSTKGHQAVWTRPVVDRVDRDTVQIFVGSGQYLTQSDHFDFNTVTQHFYGVRVSVSSPRLTRLSALDEIVVSREDSITVRGESANYRVLERKRAGTDSKGWYLALPTPGERVISDAVLLGDQIFFASVIPTNADGVCSGPATGWLQFLDKRTGLQSSVPFLDLNDDDAFNEHDKVGSPNDGTVAPAAMSFAGSTISVPQLVARPNSWDKTDAFVSRSGANGSSSLKIGFRIVAPSERKSFNVVQ